MTSSTGKSHHYAAIDLGTNTCLLLVARWDGARLIPLAHELRVVRLGTGVDRTGRLSEGAIDQAIAAFQEYQDIIVSHGCSKVRCVATSAFREAANQAELHQLIMETTGYDLVQISGREEAELVLRAVQHEFPNPGGSRLVVDVGGGTTEIILEVDSFLAEVESLPLGSVRLTERWLHSDPPSAEELQSAVRDINDILAESSISTPVKAMVAVGGTATTFVAMDQQLETYDHDRVHGSRLSDSVLKQILDRCYTLSLQERLKLPGLHSGRADVILAGGLILQAVMHRFNFDRLTVSDRGLMWGVIYDMAIPA